MPTQIQTSELLNDIQTVAADLGRSPTVTEWKERGGFSIGFLYNKYDTWNEALKSAGLAPRDPRSSRISDEELIDELQRLYDEFGESLTQPMMNKHGRFGKGTYQNRFGSWSEAKKIAGVHQEIGREDLIDEIHRLHDDIDDIPRSDDMYNRGRYSRRRYVTEFGSWTEAVVAAGLEPRHKTVVMSDSELISQLRGLGWVLGRAPRLNEARDMLSFSCSAYASRFGSWNNALEKAGFDPNERPSLTIECQVCGTEKKRPRCSIADSGNTYCSPQCVGQAHRSKDTLDSYGPGYQRQRAKTIERDGEKCVRCGMDRKTHRERYGCDLTVHHITPRREYLVDGEIQPEANDLENLMTLCYDCHPKWEKMPVRPQLVTAESDGGVET